MRFKNKVAIVTGAGKGIGKGIAIEFAKEGANIVLVSRTLKDLEDVASEIKKIGSDSLISQADISKEYDVKRVFKETLEKFKTVDILVNNAAVSIRNEIVSMSLEEWQTQLDVNLTGTFLCMRDALKIMIEKNYGKIINVSSEAGKKGCSLKSAYSATKFGQISLTESAAAEMKSNNYNININAICPSGTDTPLTRKLYPEIDCAKVGFMEPQGVAKVVLFLASEDAKYIKGSAIEVYNGMLFNIDPYDF